MRIERRALVEPLAPLLASAAVPDDPPNDLLDAGPLEARLDDVAEAAGRTVVARALPADARRRSPPVEAERADDAVVVPAAHETSTVPKSMLRIRSAVDATSQGSQSKSCSA